MSRFTGFLIGVLVIVGLCWIVSGRAAPITITMDSSECWTIQHDGVTQFQATGIAPQSPPFTTINYIGTCGGPPPPDPGAYTTLPVTWVTHTPATATINVTQFFNFFGHILPNLPIQLWPGVSGVTIKYLDSTPKYVRARLHMPINGGIATHILKAVSYGATAGLRAKFAIVAPDAPWPTGADTACYKSNQSFSDQPVLYIKPGAGSASFCGVALGSDVDFLADGLTNGVIVLSWY